MANVPAANQRSPIPPAREGLRCRWLLCIWVAAFVALTGWLPPAPQLRLPNVGPLSSLKFADEQTLIALQGTPAAPQPVRTPDAPVGPLVLVNLTTGSTDVRPLGEVQEPLVSRDWRQNGSPSKPEAWTLSDWSIRGNRLIVALSRRSGERLIRIEDWKTGRQIFSQTFPGHDLSVLHDRVWIYRDGSSDPMTIVDLETGQTKTSRLTGAQLSWPAIRVSPDGRFVASLTEGRLTVVHVSTETLVSVRAEDGRFGFSRESDRLIALSGWKVGAAIRSRNWRLYNLGGGLLAERRQVEKLQTAPEDDQVLGVEIVGDESLCASIDRFRLFPQVSVRPLPVDRIDSWNTKVDEIVVHRDPSCPWRWKSDGAGRFEPREPSRLGRATHKTHVGELDTDGTRWFDGRELIAVSDDRRWKVLRLEETTIERRLPAWIAARWPWKKNYVQTMTALCDFETESPRLILSESADVRFSPDNRWFIVTDGSSLEVWPLPLRRPLSRAFGWSLLIPLVWSISGVRMRRGRRPP